MEASKAAMPEKAVPSAVDESTHPAFARNWSNKKKWSNTLIISLTGFLSTMGSSILAPAISDVQKEFGERSREVTTLAVGLYVLMLGLGVFVFAPVSELWGRQRAYTIAMSGFTIFTLASCFAPNLPALIVLRSLCGFFGSAGPGLGVATISDLFTPQERGRPLSIYAIGPMLGPVVGSLIGAYLALADWRWQFRMMSILIGANTLMTVLFMSETYAPVVKRQLVAKLAAENADAGAPIVDKGYAMEIIKRTFLRPPRMMMNPVCALFTFYYAYIYGIIYVYIVSFPLLFFKHDPPQELFSYDWPAGTAPLCYLGLGFGFLCSAATAATCQDRIYKHCSLRFKDNGRPEYRLIICQLGMLIFPTGLLMWGWLAHSETHWFGPVASSAVLAYGLMLCFNSIQNWIVDAFFPYSAAAMAAASFLRSLTGCVLPLFSDTLFMNLGYGWGGTVLALVAVPAIPAPLLLFLYGKELRERFEFKP